MICLDCGKPGDIATNCRNKQDKKYDKNYIMLSCIDVNEIKRKEKQGMIDKNIFIVENGLFDVDNVKSKVQDGDNLKLLSTKFGKKKIAIHQKNGKY